RQAHATRPRRSRTRPAGLPSNSIFPSPRPANIGRPARTRSRTRIPDSRMTGSSPATRPVPPAGKRADTIPLASRVATLSAVVLPFLGLVAALVLLWGWGFGWADFG